MVSICEARGELEELSTQYSDALLDQESTRRALQLTTQLHQQQQLLLSAAETDLEKVRPR